MLTDYFRLLRDLEREREFGNILEGGKLLGSRKFLEEGIFDNYF